MVLYDFDFIAPLLEAEAELSHDIFDDRQHDDDWWEARRPDYVELYRISAELEAQGIRLPGPFTRSYIQLPPARAYEQEQVENEGRCLVAQPPHLRWSQRHWRVMAKEARDAGAWPPKELMRMLKAADREISFDYHRLTSSRLEFQVGDEVEIMTEAGWKEGVIVRRNYIAVSWYDYQVLIIEEDCCNSELDKFCRLLCVKNADDTCIRGNNKNSVRQMTKELCETLINEVLKVPIQAWWLMKYGYQEDDVDSGMLDEFEHFRRDKLGYF